jgi:hypothetical protein
MKQKSMLLSLFVLLSLSCSGRSATNDSSSAEPAVLPSSKPKTEAAAYLETGGERKLELLYKKTPEGDLHLDLYYPNPKRRGNVPSSSIRTAAAGRRGAS